MKPKVPREKERGGKKGEEDKENRDKAHVIQWRDLVQGDSGC